MSGHGVVGADVAALDELAATFAARGASLASTTVDAAAALRVLRHGTPHHVVPRPALLEGRLEQLTRRLNEMGREVARVTAELRRADGAGCRGLPTWWAGTARWVRAVDDAALHQLPGLGWMEALPAVQLRTAIRDSWAVSMAIDEVRGGRLDGAVSATRARAAHRAGTVAGRIVGATTPTIVAARVRDVMATPLVRGLARDVQVVGPIVWEATGRVVAGVAMVADGVDAVEEFAAGDTAAGWRSVAEVAGGALLLGVAPALPASAAIGLAIVAGVAVYENREEIAHDVRSVWRATSRAASATAATVGDTARAVDDAIEDVVERSADVVHDAARGALEGARRLVGGLF